MTFPSLVYLLCLIFASYILPTSSFPYTLDLSPIPKRYSLQNPKDIILDLAEASLVRAYQLQQTNIDSSTYTSLFPTSYGGEYTVSLSIGTPPQIIPVVFDTGSSLVWVPCTSSYSCPNCTSDNVNITTFEPDNSTTDQFTPCSSEKCGWLDQLPYVMSSCPNCKLRSLSSCTMRCAYNQTYGSGSTAGNALFETLNLPGDTIPGLFVGCSLNSVGIAQGIAGFGRRPMSLPNQLGFTKFSHCFIPHEFDDTGKNSKLILGDSGVTEGITYTPLLKNPPMLPFNQYYYVQLDQITIGGKVVVLPNTLLVPDNIGNGGSIVDSGSTFTSLVSTMFDPITMAYVDQIPPDEVNRVSLEHTSLGNVLCINVTGEPTFSFPEIIFYFKGGAQMDLPFANYLNAGEDVFCLPFANSTIEFGQRSTGPAIIFGNYQQQNFHIEYDLKNERLGIKRQNCEDS